MALKILMALLTMILATMPVFKLSIIASFAKALFIALPVLLAAWISYHATIRHGIAVGPKPAWVAALVTLFATIPPLFFTRLLANGATNQFAVMAWRMGIMFPALTIATRFVAEERKYYLIALMACYFVALPLESWVLIRDVRRNQKTDQQATDQ